VKQILPFCLFVFRKAEFMKRVIFCFLFFLFGWVARGQDVKLVVNKPFDWNLVEDIMNGPPGYFYTLSRSRQISIFRIDSSGTHKEPKYFPVEVKR
jgi:hypothetical protein